MSFTRPFLLAPVFFRTALPCSGGYHLERCGINCKKGATTEYQGTDAKYMGYEVYVDDCVCDYYYNSNIFLRALVKLAYKLYVCDRGPGGRGRGDFSSQW